MDGYEGVASGGSLPITTVSDIGRFLPKPFYPTRISKDRQSSLSTEINFSATGLRALQHKNKKLNREIAQIEQDIQSLKDSIDRHSRHMEDLMQEHAEHTKMIRQQIQNRKSQLSKIQNSQEPPTMNQIHNLVKQIQVEGMAAKRKAENSLRDQDVNLVLSGDRLKRFHDYLSPKITDTLLKSSPELRSAFEELESLVYRSSEARTMLRGLKISSINCEKRIVELNSRLESIHFEKNDVSLAIADKTEEFNADLTKKMEEIGRLKWKIEYLKGVKQGLE